MTVLIYVDARKQVVESEDLKVFAETNTGGSWVRRERGGTRFRVVRPPPAEPRDV
jgi:hypothetical protein